MPVNPKDFEYEFSPNVLVETRERLGLSQANMAERLNLPVNTVSRWERGVTIPDANSLAAIYSIAKGQRRTPEFFLRRSNPVELNLVYPKSSVIADCIAVIKSLNGKAVKKVDIGNRFKQAFDRHNTTPQDLGFNKNHLTKSLLSWLVKQNAITMVSENTDSIVVKLNGNPQVVPTQEKPEGRKTHFTIQRKGRNSYELTVVGKTGQIYTYQGVQKKGKDGHFTDEGQYRRAISQAVAQNRKS